MKLHYKTALAAVLLAFPLALRAHAAAPDGAGPWADTVVTTVQGLTKNGSAVLASRSDATSMLGAAEGDTVEGHFYSLGFRGTATLGFDNGFADGVLVVEATNPGFPNESANVEVSENGTDWTLAGSVTQDGTVEVPDSTMCVRYVRLTDTSNPADFSDDMADGYDVDGVSAYGRACTDDGKMTGGGSLWKGADRVTHGMELLCDGSKGSLQVNWGKSGKFHLDTLVDALCTDDPALTGNKNPNAAFDTYYGHGTGKYNGQPGYHAYFKFTDNGEPGTGDQGWLLIKDPTDTTTVFEVPLGTLSKGNHQAH